MSPTKQNYKYDQCFLRTRSYNRLSYPVLFTSRFHFIQEDAIVRSSIQSWQIHCSRKASGRQLSRTTNGQCSKCLPLVRLCVWWSNLTASSPGLAAKDHDLTDLWSSRFIMRSSWLKYNGKYWASWTTLIGINNSLISHILSLRLWTRFCTHL